MYEAVCAAILVILLIAWIAAEVRGRKGLRIALGLASIAFVGLMWFSAELRMAHMDAHHQLMFRQMGDSLKAGDTETVKNAVEVYNHPAPGVLREFQALDVLEGREGK